MSASVSAGASSSSNGDAAASPSGVPPPPPPPPPMPMPMPMPMSVVALPPTIAAKATGANIFEDAEHLYPAQIEWTQPCESVAVSGSFNGWGSQILLKEQKDGADAAEGGAPTKRFAITLYLPVGTHFFKFCVDGAWQYDPEVTFAPDEYGNLNNFIKILPIGGGGAAKLKPLQRALRTMIRDAAKGLPVMNPAATEELMKVRLQTSPVLNPQRSPAHSGARQRDSRSDPPALAPLPAPRKPLDTTDVEFDLNVDQIRQNSQKSLLPPRSRSGTLTRSKSEESLVTAGAVDEHAPKYSNYVDDAITSSVLLAATTQHFGGDLVTHEHSTRAKLGGHRSVVLSGSQDGHNAPSRRPSGKLIIFLVGLPGRGKTFIGHILARHLTWMGHHSKVFSTGEYRRKMIGASVNHAFWDPLNAESYHIRTELSKKCLEDSLSSLEQDLCDCVIFDATNVTRARRSMLLGEVSERCKCEVMFIESICDLPEVVAFSINAMKLNSEDYAGQTLEEAAADYNNRINHYRSLYEPLSAEEDNFPFIKVIDVGRQIFCNQMYGYLQSRIMFLMANLNLRPRPIWLSRHGESMYNTQKRIGGDSPLSPHGLQYAMQLDRFIDAYYPAPDTELAVWTSTMLRTGMTVDRIAARGRSVVKWKQLDEIDAGICDGMTYEQVAEEMPEEYLARKHNKLHYRYPRGESYQDVIHRLEPVITELMRIDQPVLIVAHQAILRVIYAYLTNKAPSECPTVNIPLHVVIQLTPKAYHCEEVWHRPM